MMNRVETALTTSMPCRCPASLFEPRDDPCNSQMCTGRVVKHDRDEVLRSDVSTQCGYWPTIDGEWAIRLTQLSSAEVGLGVKRI